MSHSLSFLRTDKAIMHAFIELLKEKSFEKITVQDILERTPVTRATFYAHYHDKYEIAERMLEQFLKNRDNIRNELNAESSSKMHQIVRKNASIHHDATLALLKIRTDKVDLRQTIVDEFEKEYLSEKSDPVEAKIYAQVRTSFELSCITREIPNLSFQYSNETFMNVFLKLLRLSDDKETKDFLNKKLKQKIPNENH